jgi:hypothetical protein
MIVDYYEHVDELIDRLAQEGQNEWSRQLIEAEHMSSTAGETIQSISVLLKLMRNAKLNDGLNADIERLLFEGQTIWSSSGD